MEIRRSFTRRAKGSINGTGTGRRLTPPAYGRSSARWPSDWTSPHSHSKSALARSMQMKRPRKRRTCAVLRRPRGMGSAVAASHPPPLRSAPPVSPWLPGVGFALAPRRRSDQLQPTIQGFPGSNVAPAPRATACVLPRVRNLPKLRFSPARRCSTAITSLGSRGVVVISPSVAFAPGSNGSFRIISGRGELGTDHLSRSPGDPMK